MNKILLLIQRHFLIGLLLCINSIYAQDTTNLSSKVHLLPEFSVSEKLDNMLSRVNTQNIDSATLDQNNTNSIGSLLAQSSSVTVNSYGVTGLSSVSMRGGNSNHTAVLWNGFNLQDPLNGGFNMSTSSSNFIDDVNVQYGGASSLYGSGAIGGTIHLDNRPIFQNKFFGSVLYKNGSFGLNAISLDLGSGSKRLANRLRLFHNKVANDFEFVNVAKIGNPTETYKNSMFKQTGILYETYFKINKEQLLSSQFWFQQNYREIPSNITSDFIDGTKEYQNDDWVRWALNWNKKGNVINYEARTGLFYARSNYVNSKIDLNSINNSLKNTTELLAAINLLKLHKITIGINNNYTVGLSDNLNNNPSLNTTSFYISPRFIVSKNFTINTSLRNEYYNQEFKPLTYSFNSKFYFLEFAYLTTSFSRNYRTPNFNDLFWNSGSARGNLNLKDEHGYSKDIGLGIDVKNDKLTLISSCSFYSNIINDQIQWTPEGQVWTPQNVKKVDTKGIELLFSSTYNITKDLGVKLKLNYTYTDAQIKEKSEKESDDIIDKQLIYIPYYQANSSLGLFYKNLSFSTHVQYMGYQFTRADNLDWIPSFVLTNLESSYKIKSAKGDLILFGKVNNIFNIEYEVRQWYPMPRLNYEIGFKININ